MIQADAGLNHELFKRYAGNPILSANEWPYAANSVFNAAAVRVDGGTVHMYYGAADSCITYATAELDDLVASVKKYG